MAQFKVTLLGTSHGDPTVTRFNTASLLELPDGTGCLIDAGTPALALLVRMGYDLHKLRYIFLTHMHEDHFGGLPDILKMKVKYNIRGERTEIFLPEEAAIRGMLDFMALSHRPIPEGMIDFHVIHPGEMTLCDGTVIEAIPTDHSSNEKADFPTYGFEFTSVSGTKVLFTGDLSFDFHDFPAGRKEDLVFCELTHYKLEDALPVLKQQNFKHLVFHHVADRWHGADAEKRFYDEICVIPYFCTLSHDGDVFSC